MYISNWLGKPTYDWGAPPCIGSWTNRGSLSVEMVPSGHFLHSYGKSQFLMGKLTLYIYVCVCIIYHISYIIYIYIDR